MRPQQNAGITVPEVMVILAIIVSMVWLLMPQQGVGLSRAQMPQALSNMRQLYLATQQMAMDGATTGDANLAWPGDRDGTFTNWAAELVPSYLSTNDFCKLLSVAGRIAPAGMVPTANTNGIVVYAVSSNSPGKAVFLSTANFLNSPTGGALNPDFSLFADRAFVVFHRDGDGAVLKNTKVEDTNAVGAYVPLCR